MTSCPPGTSPSAVSWVGTCHNPLDGKDYLISYNDCCGKTACGNVRGGRARAAGLSDVPAQRRELVHVERVVHLPLHHVGDRGPGQAQTMNGTRRFVGAAPARGGPGARLAGPLAAWSQDRAASARRCARRRARTTCCNAPAAIGWTGAAARAGIPDFRDSVGHFTRLPAGREYLIRVPGAAQSQLSDADLAAVLNWVLASFSAAQLPADFQPYTQAEVAAARRSRRRGAGAARAGAGTGGARIPAVRVFLWQPSAALSARGSGSSGTLSIAGRP